MVSAGVRTSPPTRNHPHQRKRKPRHSNFPFPVMMSLWSVWRLTPSGSRVTSFSLVNVESVHNALSPLVGCVWRSLIHFRFFSSVLYSGSDGCSECCCCPPPAAAARLLQVETGSFTSIIHILLLNYKLSFCIVDWAKCRGPQPLVST